MFFLFLLLLYWFIDVKPNSNNIIMNRNSLYLCNLKLRKCMDIKENIKLYNIGII